MTNRALQAQKTRKNVYASSLKVIQQLGYTDASIKDITDAAGVSIGTFYTYFPSKEHILLYTYEENEIFYHDAFEKAKNLVFPESLFRFIEISYSAIECRGTEVLSAIINNMLSSEFKVKIRDKSRAFFVYLSIILGKANADGLIGENVDIDKCIESIFISLTGSEIYWCLNDSKGALSTLATSNLRTLVNGLFQ